MGIAIKKWSPSPDSGHFLTLIDVRKKKVMICASKSESFSQSLLGNRTFVRPGKTTTTLGYGNRECSFLPNSFPRIKGDAKHNRAVNFSPDVQALC